MKLIDIPKEINLFFRIHKYPQRNAYGCYDCLFSCAQIILPLPINRWEEDGNPKYKRTRIPLRLITTFIGNYSEIIDLTHTQILNNVILQ